MNPSKRVAIITGASSGLGREFARQLDAQQVADELWLVARNEKALTDVASELDTPSRAVAADLTSEADIANIRATLSAEDPRVKFLVNAAGFGKFGDWQTISDAAVDSMIDLNCRAAVDVTDAAFPYLHPGSQVLEICSTAGFQPIPGLNVYAATKAFLLSYTQTLHYELSPAGIHVTAVCPYWVKDTEFIGIAEKGGHGFRHYPLASRSQDVVRRALRDSALNLRVSTPGLVCTLHRAAAKVTPNLLCLPLADWLSHV